ncbi:MAG: hypothetical protein WC734_06245 [Patescibacteria group bacterium]|jgi:hypothetical protein
MADLSILVPEATTNYIKNPSFRFDITDWIADNATITRVLDYARFGIASLKVVTNSAIRAGVYYRVNTLGSVSSTVTVSAYVRGTGHIRIRLADDVSAKEWSSKETVLETDRWQRIFISGRCSDSNDVRVYIESYGVNTQAITFYVDAVQMELKPYVTTYCDGTRPGCRWNGLYDESTSYRSPYTREGGRWVMVSGAYREQEDVYMTVVSGLGVAPIQNNRQSYAMSPGGFLDNVKIQERPITLQFHVKHKSVARTCKQALSLSKLHELRQMLIDIIKPDATGGNEPFWIEYKDGDIPVYAQVYYDGGLEGEWDIRNQWAMDFQLRLLATSPMFYEDDQDIAQIDFKDTARFNGITGRIDGEWNGMNSGTFGTATDGSISDIEIGKKGEIYICGKISTVNYSAGAIDPMLPCFNAAYYNGTQWYNLVSAILPADALTIINDMAIAPNGDVYVTGRFTNIGGVAAVNIARWNGATWSALGTGLNDDGLHVQVAPNGNVYAAGKFHSAGGVTSYHIARWDGSMWHKMGAYTGLNDEVYSMAISLDGTTVYVGGIFTDQYSLAGNAMLRVAKYTVSSDTFSAMGSGFNGTVREVVISPSNYVYACGDFTLSGIAAMKYIGKWNGSMWEQLGNGLTGGIALSMDISKDGNVVVVGEFTEASGITMKRITLWNGSTWASIDLLLTSGGTPSPIAVKYNGDDIIVGGSYFNTTSLSSFFSGITYVNNDGTAEVRPIIYIKGQAKLRYIENQTTKKKVWFNLDILVDEEVFIDFGTGRFYSTVRGDLYYSIVPGGDIHAFTLIPGENKIAAFMYNDVSAIMYLSYTPTHWSADSTQAGETF